MSRSRRAVSLWRAGLGLVLSVGCAQLFGIDEACVAGDDGCTELEPCTEYCERISTKCADNPQYDDSRGECQALCPFFEPAADGGAATNSLECRLGHARGINREKSDCLAAGRGGDGVCGDNCSAFCSLMQALCPARHSEFDASDDPAADAAACQAECALLRDRDDFDIVTDQFDEPGTTPTIQCRLWHLGSAAVDAQSGALNSHHCDHAMGLHECAPVATTP
jgi:hypothetical protein